MDNDSFDSDEEQDGAGDKCCLECERTLMPGIDSYVSVNFDTGFGHRRQLRGNNQLFCTEECLIAYLLREYQVSEYGPTTVEEHD